MGYRWALFHQMSRTTYGLLSILSSENIVDVIDHMIILIYFKSMHFPYK